MRKMPEVIKSEKLIRYKFDGSYDFGLDYKTNYGFIRSLCMKNVVEEVQDYIDSCFQYENIVQVGIGGSALGATASLEFLKGTQKSSQNGKRYFSLDNIDPQRLKTVFSLDLKKTLFHIVSKSGSTIETLSQFFVIYEKMKKLFAEEINKHFVFTTSQSGFLYEFGKKRGIKTFFIPDEVGGRYSVFTPVGLITLAFSGYDIRQFIEGAKTAVRAYRNGWGFANEFASFAIGEYKNSKNILVLFVYKDRLKGVAEWFRQLWAESLGKDGEGQTPVVSVGTTDQHSQLQLYQDGQKDKAFVFLDVKQDTDFAIESDFGFGYLKDKSLNEIMSIEKNSTKKALQQNRIKCADIFIEKNDEFSLGALYISFMIATAKAGKILNIDPFSQPGVELSKSLSKQKLKSPLTK